MSADVFFSMRRRRHRRDRSLRARDTLAQYPKQTSASAGQSGLMEEGITKLVFWFRRGIQGYADPALRR